jgi:hypothetical protein
MVQQPTENQKGVSNMKSKTLRRSLALACVICFVWGFAGAKEGPKEGTKKQTLTKTTGDPFRQVLNINNFMTWMAANGNGNNPPSQGGDGSAYPRGTRWVIYMDGVVWGAKAYTDAAHTVAAPNQLIRVGGGTYNVGNTAGAIIGTGATAVAEDANLPLVRIFRIRRDYMQMTDDDVAKDAAEFNEATVSTVTAAQLAEIKSNYALDWLEWPVSKGAPYIERNGVAGYQAPPAFNYDETAGALFTTDSLISGNYDEPGLAGADPNSPADQVIWTVANDLNASTNQAFAGSDPMGLEVQVTLWGYKRADALGELYFKLIKIINKGGVTIDGSGTKGSFYLDSMYICQWSDPDLGSYTDDLAGCDSVLSLGFVYNGSATDQEFAQFSLPPPAVGYDFLQGPAVPSVGDSAVFGLQVRHDLKNLPMTSFAYFVGGGTISDPPFSYEGGLQWYKMLQGYVPDPTGSPLRLFPHPPGEVETLFPLSGDPATRTGFLDGQGTAWSFASGDRRILLNSGPFELAPNDTQEIVVGTVGGLGADRLSSVSVMKFNDRFVQNTYDALFQVPKAPDAPKVNVAELDGKIILEWASDPVAMAKTENVVNNPGAYAFEGYNVYQLNSANASLSDAKRIITFDKTTDPTVVLDEKFDRTSGQILQLPVQYGSNSGIKRYFEFERDYIRDIGKIYNGQEYYLAVTAYSIASQAGYLPAVLESSPQVLTVRAKQTFGTTYTTNLGDTLAYTHAAGPSDGFIVPLVINPAASTGHDYRVTFDATGNVWTLTDVTTGTVKLTGQTNQTGDNEYTVVDGIMVKVLGAPSDFKYFWTVANANGAITPFQQGAFAFNANGFPLTPDGSDRPDGTVQQSSGLTASSGWGFHTGMNSATMSSSYAQFTSRVTQGGARFSLIVPYDFEMRFTAGGSVAWNAFTDESQTTVPFELWNIGVGTPNDASDDYRLFPYILDVDGNQQFNLMTQAGVDTVDNGSGVGTADHTVSGGTNDPFTDWIYWVIPANTSPGTAGYDAIAAEVTGATHTYLGASTAGTDVMRRVVLVGWNFGLVAPGTYLQNMPETGTVFRIEATKPNTATDVFTFTAPAPTKGIDQDKLSVDMVNVFPNPYYAFNAAETNRLTRFVTFSNLPAKVKVRIFNLAGQPIRTLEKDDASQFLRWDLTNQDNFPVASGMYLAYLELTMPTDGSVQTKVLKLAVIQEQEILNVY